MIWNTKQIICEPGIVNKITSQQKKKTKKMFVTVCFGPLIIQREVNYRGQWTTPPDTADLLQEKYVHIESV